jgi:hypothetical protein
MRTSQGWGWALVNLRFNVEGMKEAAEQLHGMALEIDNMQDAFEELGNQIVADINDNIQTGGHIVTGDILQHSKIFELTPDHVDVGNDAEYIEYLEEGRGPIVPINAKVLHWTSKDGDDVFSTYAGPTEPTFVVENAVLKNAERFNDLVEERIDSHVE